jgi:hypothetical protein
MDTSIRSVARAISENSWRDMDCRSPGDAPQTGQAVADDAAAGIAPESGSLVLMRPRDPYFYIELI